MSRATRPLRRVGLGPRVDLALVLVEATRGDPIAGWWLRMLAWRLRCRPSQLRRCLLGRQVSARAAGKILAAACRIGGG